MNLGLQPRVRFGWVSPVFVQYEESVFSSLVEIGKILAACQEVLQLCYKGVIALTFHYSNNESKSQSLEHP